MFDIDTLVTTYNIPLCSLHATFVVPSEGFIFIECSGARSTNGNYKKMTCNAVVAGIDDRDRVPLGKKINIFLFLY